MDQIASASRLLDLLLPHWQELLKGWAADGSISTAAKDAPGLNGESPLVIALLRAWAAGDFSGLARIELLPAASMAGVAEPYAISTGTIYLNADWLTTATPHQEQAVLTGELRDQLDGLLNSSSPLGEDAELPAATLGRSACGVFGNSAALAALKPECTGDKCGHSPSKGDISGDQRQRGLARDRPVRPGTSTLLKRRFAPSARSHRIQAPAAGLAGTANSARAMGRTNTRQSASRATPPSRIQHRPPYLVMPSARATDGAPTRVMGADPCMVSN